MPRRPGVDNRNRCLIERVSPTNVPPYPSNHRRARSYPSLRTLPPPSSPFPSNVPAGAGLVPALYLAQSLQACSAPAGIIPTPDCRHPKSGTNPKRSSDLTQGRFLDYYGRQQLNRAFWQGCPQSVNLYVDALKSCQNSYQERWRGRPCETSATGAATEKSRSVTGANSGGVDAPADEMLWTARPQPSSVYPQEEGFLIPRPAILAVTTFSKYRNALQRRQHDYIR